MVHLRYFASLREQLGTGEEQIELPSNITDISGLTRWLQTREEPWKSALADSRLQVAINQEIVRPDAAVMDGDEVAWFPPVTGG